MGRQLRASRGSQDPFWPIFGATAAMAKQLQAASDSVHSSLSSDAVMHSAMIKQISDVQQTSVAMLRLDVTALLRSLGASTDITKEVRQIQQVAARALAFDPGSLLRDMGTAATFARQVDDIIRRANGLRGASGSTSKGV